MEEGIDYRIDADSVIEIAQAGQSQVEEDAERKREAEGERGEETSKH